MAFKMLGLRGRVVGLLEPHGTYLSSQKYLLAGPGAVVGYFVGMRLMFVIYSRFV
jgi:hypothetical protein